MRRFAQRFAGMGVTPAKLQVSYAMAEAVFAVTQTQPGVAVSTFHKASDGVELVSAGRPVAGIELRIVYADGQPCADEAIGEIEIRGRSVFAGYYNAEAETAAAFRGGWYRTGDLGLLHQGELYVAGRSKDVIISYGKNFYTHDIEAIAGEVGGVKSGRVVAFGLPNDATGSEDVILLAESTLPEGPAQAALARRVKTAVQAGLNLTVAKVVVVPSRWLAKTTSGKISRRDNRERYLALAADGFRKAG
jgi:acyl-CoA synthetase (AMP-forming)/AMP-acid ligase II